MFLKYSIQFYITSQKIFNLLKFKNFLFLIVAHLSITCDILVNSITKKTFSSKKFVYSKGDYEKLKNGIESIDLKKKYKTLSTNECSENFKSERLSELFIQQIKLKDCQTKSSLANK